jgi:sulfonate transport system substrate-binding protein
MKLLTSLIGFALSVTTGMALALGPAPAPLKDKATLTIGYVKVGHLSPMLLVEEELKKMNIEVKRAEFVRYADARTALLSNSVDVSWWCAKAPRSMTGATSRARKLPLLPARPSGSSGP